MTVEKFKLLFEEWTSTLNDRDREGEIQWLVCNITHDEFGIKGFASVKIREQLLSRELMLVRSDLVFIESGANNPATFTVSIQSIVDSLEGEDLTYSDFMNLTCRESSKEDLAAIYPVLRFHEKHPDFNNLLNFYYRIGSMDSEKLTQYRRGLLDSYNYQLEEVGEVAIAI